MEQTTLKQKIANLIASKAEVSSSEGDEEFTVIDDFKYDDLAKEMEAIAINHTLECLRDVMKEYNVVNIDALMHGGNKTRTIHDVILTKIHHLTKQLSSI